MQDRLSTFLLRHSSTPASQVRNIVAATQGLAKAVVDVNNFFLDSKHAYRSHVISFTNSAHNHETCTIDKVSTLHHQISRVQRKIGSAFEDTCLTWNVLRSLTRMSPTCGYHSNGGFRATSLIIAGL